MKKVIIMVSSLYTGGAQRVVIDDINEMLARDIDIKLVTFEQEVTGLSLSNKCKIEPENWLKLYFKNSRDLKKWVKLIIFLLKEKPDLVITHMWFANNVGRIASFFVRVKKVISFEHTRSENIKTKKQLLVDRILQNFCTKIIAVSNDVKESLVMLGIKPKKIEVLFNGINLDSYKNIKEGDLKEVLGIKKDNFNFIFIGRLVSAKAVDVLIKAFSNLKGDNNLIIVGDGLERGSLESLSKKEGLSGSVKFLGSRQDISKLLKISDCMVLPSRREGFGLVLLEAMASSIPIVASNLDSIKEIIKEGSNGLLFEKDNEIDLTKVMNRMINDVALRGNIARNSITYVNRFSIKNHVDGIFKIVN